MAESVAIKRPRREPLPDRLINHVVVDYGSSKAFVDRAKLGDPLFLTWLDRLRGAGVALVPIATDLDEVIRLKEEFGASTDGQNSDQHEMLNRAAAISILERAAGLGASDVHIMVKKTLTEVQFRIKGGLRVSERLSQADGEPIARALFQGVANVKDGSYIPMEFQNGQISSEEIRALGLSSVRLVRGPCYPEEEGGSFVVMRLQYGEFKSKSAAVGNLQIPRQPEGALRLAEMGYTPKQVKLLKMLARNPSGIILLTGPTGSGKTTTLFEMLAHVARERPGKRQVTIEDPIEYPMPWAIQLAVTNANSGQDAGNAFTKRSRVSLRMDPDIIMVGEIRDKEVAKVAFDASITGHQVWSTVHVTDPFLTIDRIESLDPLNLSRKIICDHKILRGMVSQRLVPKLCPHCSESIHDHAEELPEGMLDALNTWGDLSQVRVRGKGCSHCGDGYSGLMAVAEIVVTDLGLMRDFVSLGTDQARRNFRVREDSDKSLLENAMDRVLEGVFDPRDVEDKVDLILPKGMDDALEYHLDSRRDGQ